MWALDPLTGTPIMIPDPTCAIPPRKVATPHKKSQLKIKSSSALRNKLLRSDKPQRTERSRDQDSPLAVSRASRNRASPSPDSHWLAHMGNQRRSGRARASASPPAKRSYREYSQRSPSPRRSSTRSRSRHSPSPRPRASSPLVTLDMRKINDMKAELRRKHDTFLNTSFRDDSSSTSFTDNLSPNGYKIVMKKLADCLQDCYPKEDSWYTPETRPVIRELHSQWKQTSETASIIKLPISDTAISTIDRLNFDLKRLDLDSRTKQWIPFLNQKGTKLIYNAAPDKYIVQEKYSLDMETQPKVFREHLKKTSNKSSFEPRCSQQFWESLTQEVASITKHANFIDLTMEAITRLHTTVFLHLQQSPSLSPEVSRSMNSIHDFLGFSHAWSSNVLKNSLTIQANLEVRRRMAETKHLRFNYTSFEPYLIRSRLFLPMQFQEALETITPKKEAIDEREAADQRTIITNKAFATALNKVNKQGGGQQKAKTQSPHAYEDSRSFGSERPRFTSPRSDRGGRGGRGGGSSKGRGRGQPSNFRDSRPQDKPKGGQGKRGGKGPNNRGRGKH